MVTAPARPGLSFAKRVEALTHMVRNWLFVCAGLVFAGCAGFISDLGPDGGFARSDAGPTLPVDAGVVNTPDAAVTQVIDAGGLDSGTFDAGFDAGNQVIDAGDPPGIFVAMGNGARHLRSLDDGVTWVDDATTDGIGVRTVVWGNGRFVGFAEQIISSPDGKTWSMVPKADGQWLACMVYAGGRWLASGGYGYLATAPPDLSAWAQHPPVNDYTTAHHSRQALAHGLVNGAERYVVINDDGLLFSSSDGSTWLASTGAPAVPSPPQWGTGLAYGNGRFVGILANFTTAIVSNDGGKTWSTTELASGVAGLAFGQGHFTALGNGHVFTSSDGATWVDHVESTAQANDLTYGHNTYITIQNDGDLYRSTDGLKWTLALARGADPNHVSTTAFGAP